MDFNPCSSLGLALYQSVAFLDVVVKETGMTELLFTTSLHFVKMMMSCQHVWVRATSTRSDLVKKSRSNKKLCSE